MAASQVSLQQEDNVTQECKDLMSSLPSEKMRVGTHLYLYQGFWYDPSILQSVLACQRLFQAQDTDLLLVTNPKSGTTWLKALAFAIVNRVRYTCSHHPLLTNNPHELIPFLELSLYMDNQVPDLTIFETPRLFSTHLPLVSLPESVKDSECKLVYLCRNPRDTFISHWHFINKSKLESQGTISLMEAFEQFCRGVKFYGSFWDHVLGYWKESLERPQNIFFLKFEEMKGQPSLHLKRLAEFLGYPFSLEEEREGVVEEILRLCSFENLSNLEVNKTGKSVRIENKCFFRRGEVGDSVNYLTPEMIEQLDKITEQKFQGSGLTF